MSDDAAVKCPSCQRIDVIVTRRGCCGAVWATCTRDACRHQWQIVAAPAPVYLPAPLYPYGWYPSVVCDGGTAGTGIASTGTGITGVIAELGSNAHPAIKAEAR